MLRYIIFTGLFFASCAAYACTCDVVPDAEDARNAKSVVVFRIVQAAVAHARGHSASGADIIGQVEVVDQLRGRKSQLREIRFSTERCCGMRLDVGSYFVAFASDARPRLAANTGNVFEIGKTYPAPQIRSTILDFLDRKKTFEEAFPRDLRDRTEQSPVAPPCLKGERRVSERRSPLRASAGV